MPPDLVFAALDEQDDDGGDHDGDDGKRRDGDDDVAEAAAGIGPADAAGPAASAHDVLGDWVGEGFGGDALCV